ncbi:hypothetical protein L0Z31_20975 (plasmid) [Burkholderia vietnamiensis]|uniref:hypothetical protein n=1 Tax=Burkholderia TaxID=32008 RepID=UPI001FB352E2|nr:MULTISPECIES: hypothetical protein [Burkholderia]MCO1349937.1 hypothetical protein [Burkholderia vietnamiensis]MCO1432407.1 hypothetical protein [Burkholderia vietnamiensis]UOB56587.1 hypothetical protein MRS60_05655 [Burkholderia pyrrocinia]UQN47430.1 hypothetical protein L0Y95_03940 [Burkholderia vietnamiensis]UXU86974.1 hypothetical protein LXM88_17630 [Burkholderia sp. S-53]
MLELTSEQVAGLAEIDARGYVERTRLDLIKADPKLADDDTLPTRLWNAYVAARRLGIQSDENVAAFLRIEAYAPNFYEKPATRTWLTRPGRSADERFHDYVRVIKWRIEHPQYNGGSRDGGIGGTDNRSGGSGAWAAIGARWRSLVGRGGSGGNGESVG